MLRRWWNYIKTWFGMKSEQAMDPEVEIEAAINEARAQDQSLRNQAAKVIAHRTKVANEVEDAAQDVAEAKELAKQALLKADTSARAGNASDATKWNQAAQSIAMKLQAAQKNLDTMRTQLTLADEQSQRAQQAVTDNAMRLEEIAAKRMEMMSQLEAAKMQETVNSAMASINASVGGDAPSLEEIENKIEDRMAEAAAHAQLASQTPEGAMVELERAVDLTEADATLDDLRSELGLSPAPAVGSGSTATAPETAPSTESAPQTAPSTGTAPASSGGTTSPPAGGSADTYGSPSGGSSAAPSAPTGGTTGASGDGGSSGSGDTTQGV